MIVPTGAGPGAVRTGRPVRPAGGLQPATTSTYATGIWTASTSLISSTLAGQIASEQVRRYAGYVCDSESSLYYCSARYYDPSTRQFTTADSAKADVEESAYQYCRGNPIENTDSMGLHVLKKNFQMSK
jgi:RHS repeat-associated protein